MNVTLNHRIICTYIYVLNIVITEINVINTMKEIGRRINLENMLSIDNNMLSIIEIKRMKKRPLFASFNLSFSNLN